MRAWVMSWIWIITSTEIPLVRIKCTKTKFIVGTIKSTLSSTLPIKFFLLIVLNLISCYNDLHLHFWLNDDLLTSLITLSMILLGSSQQRNKKIEKQFLLISRQYVHNHNLSSSMTLCSCKMILVFDLLWVGCSLYF
jgi:hypothetical protein